jgi:hypothetical protein
MAGVEISPPTFAVIIYCQLYPGEAQAVQQRLLASKKEEIEQEIKKHLFDLFLDPSKAANKNRLLALFLNAQLDGRARLWLFCSLWKRASDAQKSELIAATAANGTGNVISALNLHKVDAPTKGRRSTVYSGTPGFLAYVNKALPEYLKSKKSIAISKLSKIERMAVAINNHILKQYHLKLDQPTEKSLQRKNRAELAKAHPSLACRVLADRKLNKDIEDADAATLIVAHPESKEVVNRVFQNNWFFGKNYSLSSPDLFLVAQTSQLAREKILADRVLCFKLLKNKPEVLIKLDAGFLQQVANKVLECRFYQTDYFKDLTVQQLAFLTLYHPRAREAVLENLHRCMDVLNIFALLQRLNTGYRSFLDEVFAKALADKENIKLLNQATKEFIPIKARILAITRREEILCDSKKCFIVLNDNFELLQELDSYHSDFLGHVVTKAVENKANILDLAPKPLLFLAARYPVVHEHILSQRKFCFDLLNASSTLFNDLFNDQPKFLGKVLKVALGNTENEITVVNENRKYIRADRLVFLATHFPYVREKILAKRRFCINVLTVSPAALKNLNECAPGFLDKVLAKVFAKKIELSRIIVALKTPLMREKILANTEYCRILFRMEIELLTRHDPAFFREVFNKLFPLDHQQDQSFLDVVIKFTEIFDVIKQKANKSAANEAEQAANSPGLNENDKTKIKDEYYKRLRPWDIFDIISLYEQQRSEYGVLVVQQANRLVDIAEKTPAIRNAILQYEPLDWLFLQADDKTLLKFVTEGKEEQQDEKRQFLIGILNNRCEDDRQKFFTDHPETTQASIVIPQKNCYQAETILDSKVLVKKLRSSKLPDADAKECKVDEQAKQNYQQYVNKQHTKTFGEPEAALSGNDPEDADIKTAIEHRVTRYAESAPACRLKDYKAITFNYNQLYKDEVTNAKRVGSAVADEKEQIIKTVAFLPTYTT